MRVALDGVRLHLRDRGAGAPVLLFLHHFGGSSRTWTGVVDRLVGEQRCVAVDLRGFGDSDAPPAGYAVDAYAADVVGLVASLRLDRYVLVGHSMGGKVALAVAARRPAGLAALVLVAPSPPTPEPMAEAERERLLGARGDRAVAEQTVRAITARPLTASEHALVVEDIVRSARPAWCAWLEHGSREDVSARLRDIGVPVAIAVGAADPVIPARLVEREIVGRIAGARLGVVPNTGHLLPVEDPEAVAAVVRGALRRVA